MDSPVDKVIFYEKPGCVGNQAQKQVLRENGFELIVHDLLNTAWTAEKLRPFFGDTPIQQWFNASAPVIKSGEINTEQLSENEALQLMISSPILIARPLMIFRDIKQSRFIQGPVLDALNIQLEPDEDLNSCPIYPPISTPNSTPIDTQKDSTSSSSSDSFQKSASETSASKKQASQGGPGS